MSILKAQERDGVHNLPLANRRELAQASWVNRRCIHTYMHVWCTCLCTCVHMCARFREEEGKMNVINIHYFFGCVTWHLSWLGIKPVPPALGARSLNHLPTRKVLHSIFLNLNYIYIYIYKIYHVHKILSTEHIKGPKKCQYLLLNM